jgi:hypothetical protein
VLEGSHPSKALEVFGGPVGLSSQQETLANPSKALEVFGGPVGLSSQQETVEVAPVEFLV